MKQWLAMTRWYLSILAILFCCRQIDSSEFDLCKCSQTMDDQTQILLRRLNAEPLPSLDEASVRALQKIPIDIPKKQLSQIKKIENIAIPGPLGPVKARLYFPRVEGLLPVFVFFHGGGWVFGSVDEYDSICQEICHQSRCLVVSVDYHLAPDHPFPEPLNDCYVATKWIAEHIQQFGGNPNRLAIGGDSAGGNLAAAVTLMARDKGTPQIQHQVLIYPALNAHLDTLSYFLFANDYYLTREVMQFFWKMYLGPKTQGLHPYASPLQASSLAHLPSALVVLAEFDPLRDEGLAYAWRLHQHHVPVIVKRYHTIHGFINFEQDLSVAYQAIEEIGKYLRQSLHE